MIGQGSASWTLARPEAGLCCANYLTPCELPSPVQGKGLSRWGHRTWHEKSPSLRRGLNTEMDRREVNGKRISTWSGPGA